MSNVAIVGQLILQGLQQLQQYQQVSLAAAARGTDITEEEIDNLGELGVAIRNAARAEAERQRAGG